MLGIFWVGSDPRCSLRTLAAKRKPSPSNIIRRSRACSSHQTEEQILPK